MRVVRLIATAVIVVGLIVATPAAASASVPFSAGVATADTPDFTPSPNKWRAWVVNMLSSVLGAATPSKYRAEQLANNYKYAASWEQWEAALGIEGVRKNAAGEYVGIKYTNRGQGTFVDVEIANLEQKYREQAAKGTGPVRAPATPVKSFIKGLGAAGTALFAYEAAVGLTGAGVNAVGGLFGFDANGTICSMKGYDAEWQRAIFTNMVGQNCLQWDLAHDYTANTDADRLLGLTVNGVTYTVRNAPVDPSYCGSTVSCRFHGVWASAPIPATMTLRMYRNGTHYDNIFKDLQPDTLGRWAAAFGSAPTRGWYSGAASTGTWTYSMWEGSTKVADQVEQVADPERQMRCEVEYDNGTSAFQLGEPYFESSGSVSPAVCPATPEGRTPQSVTVTDTGQPVGAPPLYQEDVTPEFQEWWEQYPECQFGSCELDLIRVSPEPITSCFDLVDGCVDWHTDPNKTENYLCRYGVHDVELDECNVYAGLFQPGRITTGAPYSDPNTGQWSGGQNAPKPGGQAMNVPLQDPENPRSCDFPDFALDPVSWVLTPVNCSMERNFVPRQTVVETHFAGAAESWEGKPPQVIASAVETMALAPGATGCSRSVTLFGSTFPVIDACSGVGADIAFWSRMITSAAMVILVLVVVKRQIAGMVGYNQGQG